MGKNILIIGVTIVAISSSVGWWFASSRSANGSVPSEFIGEHCSIRIKEGTNYDGARYFVRRYSCQIISTNEDWTVVYGMLPTNEPEKKDRYHAVRTKDIETISIDSNSE